MRQFFIELIYYAEYLGFTEYIDYMPGEFRDPQLTAERAFQIIWEYRYEILCRVEFYKALFGNNWRYHFVKTLLSSDPVEYLKENF